MTATQKLDTVLLYLANLRIPYQELNDANIFSDLIHNNQELAEQETFARELIAILNKLAQDGYVNISKEISNGPKRISGEPNYMNLYSITFNGNVFIENGGYAKKYFNDENDRALADGRDRRLSNGTVYLAIGTFLLVAWEMIKTFFFEKH
jgi:hypothetical protein